MIEEFYCAVRDAEWLLRRTYDCLGDSEGRYFLRILDALTSPELAAELVMFHTADESRKRRDAAVDELVEAADFLAEMADYALRYLPDDAKMERVPEFGRAIEDMRAALANATPAIAAIKGEAK